MMLGLIIMASRMITENLARTVSMGAAVIQVVILQTHGGLVIHQKKSKSVRHVKINVALLIQYLYNRLTQMVPVSAMYKPLSVD